MIEFRIIKDSTEINLTNDWKTVLYADADEFVDANGEPLKKNHSGRTYSLICAKRKTFSTSELIARRFLAVALTITLIAVLIFPNFVSELWSQSKTIVFISEVKKTNATEKETTTASPNTKTSSQAIQSPAITKTSNSAKKSETVEEFFEKITPANIDELLFVNEKDPYKEPGYFAIIKNRQGTGYNCSYNLPNGKGTAGTGFEIVDGKFRTCENGTADIFHTFSNFNEFLKFLFKGAYYQGDTFLSSPLYIFVKKDGTKIVYHNPFSPVNKPTASSSSTKPITNSSATANSSASAALDATLKPMYDFFRKITPQNIENELLVNENRDPAKNMFSIAKENYSMGGKTINNYICCYNKNGNIIRELFTIENNKFVNREINEVRSFDNFEEVLRFLSSHERMQADTYLITKKNKSFVTYVKPTVTTTKT